jgi:uracil-DNA glycosylase
MPGEIHHCSGHLFRTLDQMKDLRAIVALGRIAFDNCVRLYRGRGWLDPAVPRPSFGHNMTYTFPTGPSLLGCFHPSQQNTFTGKLTPPMMRQVFLRARQLIADRSALGG